MFALSYLPDVCLKPILVLLALGAVWIASGGISLAAAMLTLAGATAVLAVSQIALLARRFPVPLLLGAPRSSRARRLASKWRREAHAVLLVAVVAQFFPELSILLATPVLASPELAAFGICLKLAFLVGFFVTVTQGMVTPDLADQLNRRGGSETRPGRAAPSCSAATGVTLLALALCALLGEHVLAVFGPEYVQGQTALMLLVATQVVRAAFGPSNAVLTLLGEQRTNLLVTILAFIVLAVATLLLGSLFGLVGAAAAVFAATLFWSAASAFVLHRAAGLRVDVFARHGLVVAAG